MFDNRTFTDTHNISKHIHQYTTDAVNGYKNQQCFKSKKIRIIILLVMLFSISIVHIHG